MREGLADDEGTNARARLAGTGRVNSWNEWDPLEEVIVGTARGAMEIAYEPALKPYFAPDHVAAGHRGSNIPEILVDEAERQLDEFAEALARLGIRVRRPEPVDHDMAIKTPDWQAPCGRANACPRDLLLVIGDRIIEAPMSQRARFFEYRGYRRLLAEYFREGARWIAAPKPLLEDELYLADVRTGEFDFNTQPLLAEIEPVFDAACFARFGRDLFWQPDLVSNHLGADWLRRQLGAEFRVHTLRFRERFPTHIDTTLVPIRPGVVLVNPERPCLDDGLRIFSDNDWRIIEAPPSVRSGRAPSRTVSNWISMNILMLDERTAVVEAAETPMMDLMKSLGCSVIPLRFDRVYGFGGGFHCCTTDVRRNGTLKSYFPSLDG